MMNEGQKKQWLTFIFFLLLVFAVQGISSLATQQSLMDWYTKLTKPAWTPASWVFGPVWTVLYILMALGGFLIWRQKNHPLRFAALVLFALQLILNALWSPLFFGLQNPFAGFLDLTLLFLTIVAMISLFFQISRTAGLTQIPYVIWVAYAWFLNLWIWLLNRG